MQSPVRSPTQVSPLPDVEHSAPGRHVEAGHHREALLREHEDQDRLQVCLLDITGINVHVHTITPVGYAIDPRVYPACRDMVQRSETLLSGQLTYGLT